ncbi:MAG TPA: neutral zinc metallopeptidase [Actinomycetota bacterium]|nr:neutral zinc metallopeptidase [Actinomycetota bacterium]
MRWRRLRRRSGGVIDRRGRSSGAGGFGGTRVGGMPLPVGGGIGGVVLIVLVILAFRFCAGGGFDIPGLTDLGGAPTAPPGGSGPIEEGSVADRMDAIVDDLQTTWEQDIFGPAGRSYEDTGLVLFTARTNSGCGPASSATGPFYCPADGLMYLDLDFFRELERNFGAPGDFAQAYVIAHEVGHHVQTLLGTNAAVQRESRENPGDANELSVRLELQADCFAGVWAASVYARGILAPGDVEEALAAAAAVGDDRIQERTQGRIDPETFTHGTSEQRVRWFRTGFDTGDPEACDTFGGDV